jgi:hypothetical protein
MGSTQGSLLRDQLLDRGLPLDTRIEAANALAQAHPEDETGELLSGVLHDTTEETPLRAAVAQALAAWNGYGCIPQLLSPLSPMEVRVSAIAALDALDPLDGEMEQRLTAHLQRVFTGAHDPILAASLPLKYGRDPRVVGAFEQLLEHENDLYRADGVNGLVILGELDTALAALEDEAPIVRYRLLEALRRYPDEGAEEAVESLLNDEDANVANLAALVLAELRGEALTFDWPQLIAAFGTPNEPASEEAIAVKEEELGRALPPSYREFLLNSNGLTPLNEMFEVLSPVEAVEWLAARNAEWIAQFQTEDDLSAEEHLYQPDQPETYRAAYLNSCLLISDPGEKVLTLLNPEVADEAGEWEAWFFGPSTIGGAVRYPSFAHLLESQAEAQATGAE